MAAPERFVVAVGTRGRIEVEKPFIPGWTPTRVRVVRDPAERTIEVAGANHYLHMVEHFGALVRDPHRPAFPAEDGAANVAACAAIADLISTQSVRT